MTREIQLTKGFVTLVDDEDFEELTQWGWHANVYPSGHVYAYRSVIIPRENLSDYSISVAMHRQILWLPQGDPRKGDHINGDTLDNRRSNLRTVTDAQNCHNRALSKLNKSGYKGVSWHKGMRQWAAQITCHGRVIHLGYRRELEEAVVLRKEAEQELHGEYARRSD